MNDTVLAPVLIVTYDRLEHLNKTITSLQENILAEQTDLFVASDFQRSDSEVDEVAAVRSYLKSVDGFKSVTIFEREKNFGVEKNCDSAVQFIFSKFARVIIMNDDLVTAPGYLKFMNEAFERYEKNERVFSITGYCPPIRIPLTYRYDAFFLGRMSAWGCGMTKDRYDSVREITRMEYDEFAANKELSSRFVQGGGKDMLAMLSRVAYGSLEAWDVQCMYTQFLNSQLTIYPTQSLVQNIGFDGTGMHCGISDRFDVPLSDKTTFLFPDEIIVDRRIVRANLNFRDGNIGKRLRSQVMGKTHKFVELARRVVGKARREIKQLLG